MRARWSRLAGLALVAALVGGLLQPPMAARPARAAGQIRWGYYVTYAGDSLTSLRAHVDSLTHVSPFYYTLGAGGAIDLKEEQPETTRFLRSRGVAIVPMIKNSATYDAFHALLDSPEERDRLVADLVRLVETRDYDGIHIDFEGVNAADRPLLTDFMHRLHAQLRPRGKLTTMAVAAKARDVTTGWAGAYDYAALAPALDLAVVMAYDFHWSSGPTPGPVAPVPWQRGVLAFAAAQFGADKTLLGLPFYGLDWNTTTGPPARSVRMADGPALLRKPGATGGYSTADEANWVRWTEDGEAHEAWYEDERSLAAKLALVADLGLAGFATWRLGHEDEGAWAAIRRLDTPATRVPPVPDTADRAYFAQTGHTVSGPFLRYWARYGGLEQFGLPRTEVFEERSPYDGRPYQVQYFERARFEYHPEHAGTEYEVLLGLLGRDFHPIDPPAPPLPDADYFPQTGHNLGGPFRDYWLAHGGLFVSGLPISEELIEISPDDGQPYRVQYFERARYELHPEHAGTPYEVLLGLLGNRLLRERGWIR